MDPLTIMLFSIVVVLVALIIVNIFYVVNTNKHKTTGATTQTEKNFVTDHDTQTLTDVLLVSHSDEEIQASPFQSTVETITTTYTDNQIQMDLVFMSPYQTNYTTFWNS